jgi:tRNA U34 5-carboxymethylaminomethyl modifying GTPase MnmE/TrmE
LHLFDTAGLDAALLRGQDGHLDQAAQAQSAGQLQQADVILLVLDGSEPKSQLDKLPLADLPAKDTIVVLNKSDLPRRCDPSIADSFAGVLDISAQDDVGIDTLLATLKTHSGIDSLDISQPAPFTPRQVDLLQGLARTSDPVTQAELCQRLLNGPL